MLLKLSQRSSWICFALLRNVLLLIERKILREESEKDSKRNAEEDKRVVYFFICYFPDLLWQQEEDLYFKYKANETENFIAVYKRGEYIALHMERSVWFIKKNASKNSSEMVHVSVSLLFTCISRVFKSLPSFRIEKKNIFQCRFSGENKRETK